MTKKQSIRVKESETYDQLDIARIWDVNLLLVSTSLSRGTAKE